MIEVNRLDWDINEDKNQILYKGIVIEDWFVKVFDNKIFKREDDGDSEKFTTEFIGFWYECLNLELVTIVDNDKLEEDFKNGRLKVGKSYRCLLIGDGRFRFKNIKVKNVSKSSIGENLEIVRKTFKNLKNDWFKDWEFIVKKDNIQIDLNHKEKKKDVGSGYVVDRLYFDETLNFEGGDFLEIRNDKIGRILLGEYEEKRFNDKYDFVIVVKKIERFKDGIKGKMGSVLTILNRVCKGKDILIEIEVGDIGSDLVEYDFLKLLNWYEKRGFKVSKNKTLKSGMSVIDSREVLEEYCERMGWNDE